MDQQEFVQEAAQRRIDEDIAKRIKVHQANIERLETARESAGNLESQYRLYQAFAQS